MDGIFEEVNEDLKQKQLKEFWEENKNWIIGGVVGSIIATAAMSGYRSWEHKRDVRETSRLSDIVSEIQTGNTEKLEAFIPTTDKNHALTARMVLAATYINNGKTDKAIEVYKDIASTIGINKNYKDYAKFLSLKYDMDKLSSDEIIAGTNSLTNTNWKHVALELQALSLAKENKFSEAINTLNKLTSDSNTPNSLRNRAIKLTELYNAKLK